MTSPTRERWNIGAYRIPRTRRTAIHQLITPGDDRGFRNIIGAEEDVRLGGEVTYSLEATREEIRDLVRPASNLRYVEPDRPISIPEPVEEGDGPDLTASALEVPATSTLEWLGVDPVRWSGEGTLVGVLDGGSNTKVRTAVGATLVVKRNFTKTSAPGVDGITTDHGCKVTALAVPRGGKLAEGIVFDRQGNGYQSTLAAGIRWLSDRGALVINASAGGPKPAAALADAIRYHGRRGGVLVAAAGNSGDNWLEWPARYCVDHPNVAAAIAFVEDTRRRAPWSNHDDVTRAGVAPGSRVLTLDAAAIPRPASGTSFASPLLANLITRGTTGGRYKPTDVLRALVATAVDTPEPAEEEGGGAWNLAEAMTWLETNPPTTSLVARARALVAR